MSTSDVAQKITDKEESPKAESEATKNIGEIIILKMWEIPQRTKSAPN